MELQVRQPIKPAEALEVHVHIALLCITLVPIVEPLATTARPPLRQLGQSYNDFLASACVLALG